MSDARVPPLPSAARPDTVAALDDYRRAKRRTAAVGLAGLAAVVGAVAAMLFAFVPGFVAALAALWLAVGALWWAALREEERRRAYVAMAVWDRDVVTWERAAGTEVFDAD